MTVHLTRHHGLGNVFLVALVDEVPENAREWARQVCDPVTGIGADGLIIGTPAALASEASPTFALFNRDGSRAEMSGNGLRCFGQAVARANGVTDLEFVVATDTGPRRVSVFGGPTDPEVSATVDLGPAGPGPELEGPPIDLGGPDHGRLATVDVGNPHLVVEVVDPEAVDLAVVGPALEARFTPEGCNVHLVAVVDRSSLFLRPWERGVGLTEACGTGACAAAYAAHSWGLVDPVVEVIMPGGRATVSVGDTLRLTGPATFIDEHEVDSG